MVVFPNAKINLGLFVTEKRADGFHNIETVFVPVPGFNDVLEVLENKESQKDILTTTGIPTDTSDESNLVMKALKLIREDCLIPPLKIHLHKNIPSGAGLGGGSSDAAFMLRLLNDQFHLKLQSGQLEEKAAILGADCAFFVRNHPVFAEGIGNKFSPIATNLQNLWIMLVIPPIHLSTPAAYKNITPKQPEKSLKDILKMETGAWPENLINDFEPNAFHNHPKLMEIKNRLYAEGALYAAMSGSGSAMFGLFDAKPEIEWPREYRAWAGQLQKSDDGKD
ncbi:4-(cytidine 5'-diphospho)-2-C-methyl-D-erythritol kinase [Marinilabilia salmonicolor]|jgi:4-diphosphocytidyl-2-C-methyl-D-erythritol kinase|uniref:4-diphosphocytidyl-2-C-methyl-D-erythritol kinase n=1 Tax=Marinilabilia salmonicolor TaxID=989 RepID=A0A2T0XA89_9BACT|nr:4-(cytidine 5'-diphospho)-2-C-methyl-D-erythritol kinase [Marinilabilia salmonicolor]PRY95849.1 4-diphosphocytidyl-2-C-methyl-D-erythritol kinase [Marinilabilia salmonicolor]RCW36624.1 4-diphosphocytidyl-2-C-methyl-D-erythritol kinase [Marinilabilia salmonicolor]